MRRAHDLPGDAREAWGSEAPRYPSMRYAFAARRIARLRRDQPRGPAPCSPPNRVHPRQSGRVDAGPANPVPSFREETSKSGQSQIRQILEEFCIPI